MALWLGTRGSHMVDSPTTRAFDGQVAGLSFRQQSSTVSAPNLLEAHGIPLRLPRNPAIESTPDQAHGAAGYLCEWLLPPVGPWSGAPASGRWGCLLRPRLFLSKWPTLRGGPLSQLSTSYCQLPPERVRRVTGTHTPPIFILGVAGTHTPPIRILAIGPLDTTIYSSTPGSGVVERVSPSQSVSTAQVSDEVS